MKVWTKKQEQEAWDANVNGGLRGLAYAAGICIPGFIGLQRFSPQFRQIPIPLRAFGAVVITVPLVSICAEKAGEEYERSQWTGVGKVEMDKVEMARRKKIDSMSTGERVKDWALSHQWGIVFGSWATSMAVAGAIVARDRYMTFPQKLVQARMYAQFLTVGVVIGSGVLAGINSQGQKPQEQVDHSWKDILEAEGVDVDEKPGKALAKPQKAKA